MVHHDAGVAADGVVHGAVVAAAAVDGAGLWVHYQYGICETLFLLKINKALRWKLGIA